ncbi:hypothetical protein J2W14_001686 [Pseudarthrobacter oxydans]|uniref:hypothetical protein n=1 Tax=Pseudarthrobacter oxydans TaxID=1671 RepID=UPI00277EEAF0|nr:hypothetical protein [Pseudarthrobacter oxydans]MDP9982298.1 hypothetical protein [Pseudarthrobacter oxydans]
MSEIKSLAAPKVSFDRRAVVKGAAWSVPVIAAAIAAPAAAASTPPSAKLSGVYAGSLSPNNKKLTAPSGLDILNTSGVPGSDNVTVTVTITRTAGSPGVFIASLGGVPPTSGTGTAYADNVLTAMFTILVTRPTATQNFALAYSRDGGASSPGGSYAMNVSVSLPTATLTDSSALQLGK